MATQKSRTPWADAGRPLDMDSLLECGSEISVNPRIDIFMGEMPDPENTGAFKSAGLRLARDGWSATATSSDEAAKFEAGDCVIIYDANLPQNPAFTTRTAVATVSGTTINFAWPVKLVTGNITIAKELIFRVSNRNCYKYDRFGFGRYYSSGATASEVETSMGELFEYEYNTSDYQFQIQNYQGQYNDYLPGGAKQVSFGGRYVQVWLGSGEEYIKNKLIFEGITHFNAGVSEENEVLTITAYHISFIYNEEISKNRYKNVLDKDFENKVIPILYGDWTSNLMYVGSKDGSGSYPGIPTCLVATSNTYRTAQLQIPYVDAGLEQTFTVKSKHIDGDSLLGNGYQLKLEFYDYVQPDDWSKSGAFSVDGTLKIFTIKLFQGVDTSGVSYNSTAFIKAQIEANGTATAALECFNPSNTALRSYRSRENNNTSYSNYNYFSASPVETYVYTTSGGQVYLHAEYKICQNNLDSDTTGYAAWYAKGGAEDPNNWQVAPGKIGGLDVTVEWDTENGRVFIRDIPTDDSAGDPIEILDWKLFVAVRGLVPQPTLRKTDSKVVLNVAHNESYMFQNKSRNAIVPDYLNRITTPAFASVPAFIFGRGVDATAQLQVVPYTNFDVVYFKYFYSSHVFQKQALTDLKDFVFEMEVKLKDGANTLKRSLLALSFPDTKQYGLEIGLNEGYVCVNWNNRAKNVQTDSQPLVPGTAYRVRVQKDANAIKVFIKNLDTDSSYTECTYAFAQTWSSLDNCEVYFAEVGYTTKHNPNTPLSAEVLDAYVGVVRFANDEKTFTHEEFVDYSAYIVNITDATFLARRILQHGGVPAELLDETWQQFAADKLTLSYDMRCYINEENTKAVEYATQLLGQIGIVLTMKPRDNQLKFSLVWDSVDHYRNSESLIKISDYDIEIDSVSVDREINQYFNSAYAEYNYMPGKDENDRKSLPYYEPAALDRDAGVQHWYRVEEKDRLSLELPNIYQSEDAGKRIKDALAISTPNTEQISMTLSWRYLFLELGQFVKLTWGRYQNVPCQVRSLAIDANGSKVKVKLMSLENIKFLDAISKVEYEPAYFDGIGGYAARASMITYEDGGDI